MRVLRRTLLPTAIAALVLPLAASTLFAEESADVSSAEIRTQLADYRRPGKVPDSRSNPQTPAKVALGKALFFDPRLSGSGMISCASCHNPSLAWADALPVGIGHMGTKLARHTPTIIDVAFGEPYFWDGRAATLEDQAKGPLGSEAEMNMSVHEAIPRLRSMRGYAELFAVAYPGKEISIDTIAGAIAAYERTIVSGKAPFDRWVEGDDSAVSASAKRGFVLFNTKAKCAACHIGWRFSDDGFHDIGVAGDDIGRARVVPGIVQMQHAFKTPTLRNIVEHGPYMHDGSITTLEAVVEHYDNGFVRRPSLDAEMVPLHLTVSEKRDLVEFMKTLTSVDAAVTMPLLPN
jgi:cytochrome c peroxidase